MRWARATPTIPPPTIPMCLAPMPGSLPVAAHLHRPPVTGCWARRSTCAHGLLVAAVPGDELLQFARHQPADRRAPLGGHTIQSAACEE
jgi:hypothetical protein